MAKLQDFLRERKFPFIFSLISLFLCVAVFLVINDQFSLISVTDLEKSQLFLSQQTQINSTNFQFPNAKQKEGNLTIKSEGIKVSWKKCKFSKARDYIPCLDNKKAIQVLASIRRKEHRERHCPQTNLRCLVPLPKGYKTPVPWPKSRDKIWFNNVPYSKLVEYKKDQHWVQTDGEYLVFPGGGTQFKGGVANYVRFIDKVLPTIEWGKHTRVVLDVGCGVASFGGYLLSKDVLTLSFAPKDEHEAQIQLALERGIPSFLSVIGTQKLNFPDNVYDLVHCARCRVHWNADGGLPLLELNRIIRPGGFFVWSATPVYRNDEIHKTIWNDMVDLTNSICWKVVAKGKDSDGIGLVIYQKPVSNSCYTKRNTNAPPLCKEKKTNTTSWYVPLEGCLPQITGLVKSWPKPWPERLTSNPVLGEKDEEKSFFKDTEKWASVVKDVYLHSLNITWSNIRNVMDMNAGYGGFASALFRHPVWVMNVVPIGYPDTLRAIFDRGLIGIYHDWCEAFNTYPRTYDLLHASNLFENLTKRCDIIDVAVEMDRILRPGGWVLLQDTVETITMIRPLMHSLHWHTTLHGKSLLVARKGFWRPLE